MAIQDRRGTASAWTSANPTLAAGEHGYETDTDKSKIGDGSTAWNSLGYQPSNRQGASTAKFKVGGRMPSLPNLTAVGNVGSGEDDLISYTIPANTFAANGDTIEFDGYFLFAASGTLKAYIGATQLITAPNDNGAGLDFQSDTAVRISVKVMRLDSDSLFVVPCYTSNIDENNTGQTGGMSAVTGGVQVNSLDFTGAITFKFTGEGSSNDDVIQKYLDGIYTPAN